MKHKLYDISKKMKKEDKISLLILAFMITVYTIIFTYIPWTQQDAFATFGFDLGYADNRIWLVNQYISGNIRFDELFSTVGGHYVFGAHVEPILFLLAPFYWIWSDVKVILFLQTFVIALGAIPLYLIAYDKTKNRFVSLIFSFAYLMYPALQYINLFHIHYEAFATTFLLFSFYFATKNRYVLMFVFSILAMMTKEDIALVTMLLGGYVFLRHNKKFGALIAVLSILWFLVAIKFILPFYSGEDSGFIFRVRYGAFGNTIEEAAIKAITDPAFTYRVFMEHEGPKYTTELLVPTAFIALLSPETLLIALPTFAENVFSAHPLQHTIYFQYNAAIIPFIFISLVCGYSRLVKWKPKYWKLISAIIFSVAFLTNVIMSPSPISAQPAYYLMPDFANDVNYVISSIPNDARVSAHYSFLPHMTHRRFIYEFPNPFKCNYWGVHCENQHDPKTIEYVLVSKDVMSPEWKQIIDDITQIEFSVLYETDRILLLRRNYVY